MYTPCKKARPVVPYVILMIWKKSGLAWWVANLCCAVFFSGERVSLCFYTMYMVYISGRSNDIIFFTLWPLPPRPWVGQADVLTGVRASRSRRERGEEHDAGMVIMLLLFSHEPIAKIQSVVAGQTPRTLKWSNTSGKRNTKKDTAAVRIITEASRTPPTIKL